MCTHCRKQEDIHVASEVFFILQVVRDFVCRSLYRFNHIAVDDLESGSYPKSSCHRIYFAISLLLIRWQKYIFDLTHSYVLKCPDRSGQPTVLGDEA